MDKGLCCKLWGSCLRKVWVLVNKIKKIEVLEVLDVDYDIEMRIEWSDVIFVIDFLSFCMIFIINIFIILYFFIVIIDNKEN